jgi:hypothetical protein
MGTGSLFPEIKRGQGVTLTPHPNLVPRSRMRSYTPLPLSYFMAYSGTALLVTFTSILFIIMMMIIYIKRLR